MATVGWRNRQDEVFKRVVNGWIVAGEVGRHPRRGGTQEWAAAVTDLLDNR